MERLTDEQRVRVEENMGLVHVHLSRHVDLRAAATRDREVDDLFQEGLLALVRAAMSFDPLVHEHFAPYALVRIKSAVSLALHERFSTLRVPAKVRRQIARGRRETESAQPESAQPEPGGDAPTVVALGEAQRRLTASPRTEPCEASGPTMRERLGELCTAAVEEAAAAWCHGGRRITRRTELVNRVVHDRLLVPEAEDRTSLRRIAGDVGVSVSYVISCERFLLGRTAQRLEDDPEYRLIRRTVRRDADDWNTVIDADFRSAVRQAWRERLRARFGRLDAAGQGVFLSRVVAMTGVTVERLAAEMLEQLSEAQMRELVVNAPVFEDAARADTGPARPVRTGRSHDPTGPADEITPTDASSGRRCDPDGRGAETVRRGRRSLDRVRTTP